MRKKYLAISPKVLKAIENNKPLVALESTIIAHGMPYPKNAETALLVESEIRQIGAVPATIAVLNGIMTVGLSPDQIQTIARKGHEVQKVSRRDLPVILAKGLTGATTVASTMIGASWAGISVFATGGIGGVHRGATTTMDISADLQELAQTNVAVVCAGAKSILDIGLTLEYLETYGVPVIGYKTSEFPAFYIRESGFGVDYDTRSSEEIAEILHTKWSAGLKGGAVIADPIPQAFEMDGKTINTAIDQAVEEAAQQGISGKSLSPFLLARVEQITGGASLDSNIQLVLNNARLAAQIAIHYCRLKD